MISVLTRKNVFIVSLWFFINTIYLWYLWNVHFFVICLMLPVVPTGWPFSARCTHFELFSQLCIESACSLNLILLTWRIGWAHNNASKWQMGFNLAFKGLNRIRKLPTVWPICLWNLPGTLFDKFPPSITYFDCFELPFLRVVRINYLSSGYFDVSVLVQLVTYLYIWFISLYM